ncbi:putative late blight resistance protein homolog R1C-3 [Olea europaea var. sylvestris]|uniref:putative late blight resistance protein homolog R1C-3 n=1 Tax=Olea europaea var. sylvestris TaxID=158386 RepID=UPI000C1D4820|nr:putative late blight resistance protein homolog R1C-3 [Olea europaea var. sylvestris]XP_022846897.1 putative late blight resistance protein homolog R1C-3 [Olea europaea var. sylvestris]
MERSNIIGYFDEVHILFDYEIALCYKNLSRLLTSPDLLFHLQDLKFHGREKVVSFQWLGPHFLTFLKWATQSLKFFHRSHDRLHYLHDPLKRLDDSAFRCLLFGETEHYRNFTETILSFMPHIRVFLTIQGLLQLFNREIILRVRASFIDFLFQSIGELLISQANSSVLVSNQVKVLLKELKFLLTFLADTIRRNEAQSNIFLAEVDVVINEVGLFLHSFFFTADPVTLNKMDLAISVLLERIEIVKVKIKDYRIAVSWKLNRGIGSLKVAESLSEVSLSQNKSISTVEEMIVGLEDMTTQTASKLLGGPNYRHIISIVGMGGLGKTTLAKNIYFHSNVRYHFDKLSWCVVSQTYKKRKLLIEILSSISNLSRDSTSKLEDEDLAESVYKSLKGTRYLIVFDDLWDKEAWDDLKKFFPEDRNGSRVLFTSRLKHVALEISHVIIELPPLSPGESWNLLEQNMFKKERCPQELQRIGKQIATNCNGLPLSIITISGVLSNMEKKESLWQKVAKSLSFFISQRADDYIPTLKLSYMHLPNHLKPCFLYLSAFQEDEEIPIRKILLLWIAEGLVEKKEHKSLEDVAEEYIMELINRSLLQVSKRGSDNGVKSLIIHDLILETCCKMALEDETFLLQQCRFSGKCFPNLNFLSQLESLAMHGSRISSYYSMSNFPGNIKKLTLSEIGLPWENMSLIGTLPNLEILKLESGACEGENWVTNDDEFQKLKFLRLRHLRLKQWKSSSEHFPVLERLVLHSCIILEMIPFEFRDILTLQKIEIDRCHENVEKSASEIFEEQLDCGNEEFVVIINSVRLFRL